jgi:hypothetical protein
MVGGRAHWRLKDLDAILDRYSDEETADIRRILAAHRAA